MAHSALTYEQVSYLVQFIHPIKHYAGMPGQLDDAAIASLFGIDVATYHRIKLGFAENVRKASDELLTDVSFSAQVDRLPFKRMETVVAVGDSLTDDDQSWFEILRQAILTRRPRDAITLINAGISAETTTEVFKRFIDIVRLQPDWIICAIGANDTWFWTDAPLKLSVSLHETERNLTALHQYAALRTNARWLWFTPPAMIPDLVLAHWYQGSFEMMTRNEDLSAIAEVIRRQPYRHIDLQNVLGNPPDRQLYMSDGLHPSLEGHKAIVRAFVELLTQLAPAATH